MNGGNGHSHATTAPQERAELPWAYTQLSLRSGRSACSSQYWNLHSKRFAGRVSTMESSSPLPVYAAVPPKRSANPILPDLWDTTQYFSVLEQWLLRQSTSSLNIAKLWQPSSQ